MKKLFILFIGIIFYNGIYGQVSQIKEEIAELFFEVPLNASKYNVRKILNESDLVVDVRDIEIPDMDYIWISGTCSNNYKLGTLNGISKMNVSFVFEKSNSQNISRSLEVQFIKNKENIIKAERLINEILNIFSPYSLLSDNTISISFQDDNSKRYYAYTNGVKKVQNKHYLEIVYWFKDNVIFVLTTIDNRNI